MFKIILYSVTLNKAQLKEVKEGVRGSRGDFDRTHVTAHISLDKQVT